MDKEYEMHVISHVHWDREWRYSFAETRLQLVDMMDRLFEILDSEVDFRHYHLDAHTVLLEDYLAIRPEMADKLKGYIRAGRILVGPWYSLPEEFVVSGESLVRNLLFGHQTAEKYGPVMKVGYTPTSCGQISQLPQIYNGFDINSVLFYRGINPNDAPAEFLWQGADGTKLPAFHFYSHGRANFFALLLDLMLFGGHRELRAEERKNRFLFTGTQYQNLHETRDPMNAYHTNITDQFHMTGQQYPYLHQAMEPLTNYHGGKLGDALARAKEDAVSKATTKYLLYMDGCDNGAAHLHTLQIIKDANEWADKDKYIHSSLPVYVEKVRKAARGLKVLRGEMRRQAKDMSNALYSGILSARLYIKQRNARAENNLAGRAEPWATIAWLLGHEYPKGQLDRTWKYLLANQTHDGMQGICVDAVHRDMEYRYDQVDETAHGVLRRSLGRIVPQSGPSEKGELTLVVFNPLAHWRSEIVTADINFPADKRWSGFTLYDGDREIPNQIVSRETRAVLVEWLELNTRNFPVDSFKVRFKAEDIPPLGYKMFRVVPGKKCEKAGPSMIKAPGVMENEYLAVKINPDGSLRIRDKETGRTYDKLNVFEDTGEVGDGLWHKAPKNDSRITSANGKATSEVTQTDCFSTTYRITVKLRIPTQAARDKTSRSKRAKMLTISSLVTLRKGSKRVDVVTTFDNQCKDHRLRVLFPSGIDAGTSHAAGQFDVLSRPHQSPYRKGWAEEQITVHPNYGFVDVNDRKAGLAILNEGLTEYEVIDGRKKTIALTLVRSIENICGVDSCESPGSQCLRTIQCRYAIYPHSGDCHRGKVFQEFQHFSLPFESAQHGRVIEPGKSGASFFELGPDSLVLSALKRSETGNSVIIRFFNPTSKAVQAKLSCFRRVKRVWETNLHERRLRAIKLRAERTVSLGVKSKKIVTVELMLDGTN